MNCSKRGSMVSAALVGWLAATPALAQVAPSGGHQAAKPSDTGFAGVVNSTGGYSTSVPLDLQPAKNGLPVPVQVTYGGRGVGAAGMGWDVPISYILRDTTYAHRLPALGPANSPPRGTERLTLVMNGQSMLLMRKGDPLTSTTWVPAYDGPQIEVHEDVRNGGMLLYDGAGRTYAFFNSGSVGPPDERPRGHVPLFGGNLYTLASITAPGNKVSIEYLNWLFSLPGGGIGLEINLHSISYNSPTATGTCYKNRIVLTYDRPEPDPKKPAAALLSTTMIGDGMLVRMSKLRWIDMHALDGCGEGATDRILRRHVFTYDSDPDTGVPRLISVDLHGREGTSEHQKPISLGVFSYGTASRQLVSNGTHMLEYALRNTISFPSPSDPGPTPSLGLSSPVGDRGTSTWHQLIDFTGDGRPDFVYRHGNSMMLATNQPAAGAASFRSPVAMPATVLGYSTKPLQHEEISGSSSDLNPERRARHGRNQYVYRQLIDVNGDGRVDVIDAHEAPGQWVFYLNTPGADASQIAWLRRPIDMTPLMSQLAARGFGFEDGFLPVLRRHTGMESRMDICFKWDDTIKKWVELPPGETPTCQAGYLNDHVVESTYVEWEIRDINGDGQVDVVFNHAPVIDDLELVPPKSEGRPDAPQRPGELKHKVLLDDNSTIEAVINVLGPFLPGNETTVSGYPFSAPVQIRGSHSVDLRVPRDPSIELPPDAPPPPTISPYPSRSCGVALWVEPREEGVFITDDPQFADVATEYCAFADINGDGLVDRIEGMTASLQSGSGVFGATTVTLPSYAQGHTDTRRARCCDDPNAPCPETRAPQIEYFIEQTFGLKDLNGDGILDYLNHSYNSSTEAYSADVRLGTGSGFADRLTIPSLPAGLAVSQDQGDCAVLGSARRMQTLGGLYDVDGDGQAEMVFVNGQVYQLTDGAGNWGRPAAGRLLTIENGMGAITTITYRSAKEDTATLHAVPFPEIVATKVETVSRPSHRTLVAAEYHAFGNPQMTFDSLLRTWRFSGYRRTVEMRTDSDRGVMLVTDTSGLAPVFPGETATGRFLANARVGRPTDITILSGHVGGDSGDDPWQELGVNIGLDPRIIGASHYEYAARMFEEPRVSVLSFCGELVHPYDFLQSIRDMTAFQACASHGFVFVKTLTSWRGTASPGGSTANVRSLRQIGDVDDFGNVLEESRTSDGDPSLIVRTSYAIPSQSSGSNAPRVLGAPRQRDVYANGMSLPIASERWIYDLDPHDHPTGTVTNGLVTLHGVLRIKDDGSRTLGEDLTEIAWDDINGAQTGVPTAVTRTREGDDGHITAIRKVSLTDYDAFRLAPTTMQVFAVGLFGTPAIPTLTTRLDRDEFTLAIRNTTDPNGVTQGKRRDGFDRVTMTTITPPAGSARALSYTRYLGFDKGSSDPRSIIHKVFTDAVDAGEVATAAGRTSTVFLDELGRELSTEIQLGADYNNQTLIAGLRRYDEFGRVNYEADPYLSTQTPSYGTLRYFRDDGSPDCIVRRPIDLSSSLPPVVRVTDESNAIYPTCFGHSFTNHQEVATVQRPDSLFPRFPQDGVIDLVVLSASGRRLSHSTLQDGVRLEHAEYGFNGLGHLNQMTRYRDPADRTRPVTTSWKLDSFGLVLELHEPGAATRTRSYDSWGEMVDEQWNDGTRAHHITSSYDALGRILHREESTRVGSAEPVIDADTVNDYAYDTAVAVTGTTTLQPTNVVGRLSRAVSPTRSVVFSYDVFGNIDGQAFTDSQLYVERSFYHADGTLSSIDLFLPDNTREERNSDVGISSIDEKATYMYDSAGRVKSVSMSYSDDSSGLDLFSATTIDVFGRIRQAQYGNTTYATNYEETGRKLLTNWRVSATVDGQAHSREVSLEPRFRTMYDPVGRERGRTEVRDGDLTRVTTYRNEYDSLGRLQQQTRFDVGAPVPETQYDFSYDPLGNLAELFNSTENVAQNAVLTYPDSGDLDRICRIRYAFDRDTPCNVLYDVLGNITQMPLGNGATRTIDYFSGGAVRSVSDDRGNRAQYKYDAFGGVAELQIDSPQAGSTRHDRRYSSTIAARDELVDGGPRSVVTRTIPLPDGVFATRHGATSIWIFGFGEDRGNRFFTDQVGNFVQDVGYQPYGALLPTTTVPAEQRVPTYSSAQWNAGDALEQLGVVQLGARLYDPIIGRFLSRDPLLIPRTSTTTNPYAFAMNDPIDLSDPSGFDADRDPTANGFCWGPEMCGWRISVDPFTPGAFSFAFQSGHADQGMQGQDRILQWMLASQAAASQRWEDDHRSFLGRALHFARTELLPRALGGLKVLGAAGIVAIGAALCQGTFGLACVAGVSLAGLAADVGRTGAEELIFGESTPTFLGYVGGPELQQAEEAVVAAAGITAAVKTALAGRAAASRANPGRGPKAIDPNRLNHIFGKAEHALDDFVAASGGREAAFRRIQEAANAALRKGRLTVGPNGILPRGNAGNIIDVGGTQIRLIGGRVVDGVVEISSASRMGLP